MAVPNPVVRHLLHFSNFTAVEKTVIEKMIQHLKSSSCCLDVLPTPFFKSMKCMLTDLHQIINSSLQTGSVPKQLKVAAIRPLPIKRSLDASVLNNYRPILNLSFIAKILEKEVYNQLSQYLNSNNLLDKFQSGYRCHHRPETALIRVSMI